MGQPEAPKLPGQDSDEMMQEINYASLKTANT
jgi:hypothetical protein